MEKIKVLVVEPEKEPYIKEIDNTLEGLQNEVDGFIEVLELERHVDVILNEEGKINNLPFNRAVNNDVLCGTFIVTGEKNGDTISLSDEMIDKYKEYFKLSNHQQIIEKYKSKYNYSSELANITFIGGVCYDRS